MSNATAIAGQHRFTLHDTHGKPHQYMIQEFNAQEGLELMCVLGGLGVPALAGTVSVGLRSPELLDAGLDVIEGRADGVVTSADREQFSEMTASVDLAPAAREFALALLSGKVPGLVQRLMESVFRDGAPMSDAAHFNAAYRANYAELMKAAVEVCRRNGFFLISNTTFDAIAGVGKQLMPTNASATDSDSTASEDSTS